MTRKMKWVDRVAKDIAIRVWWVFKKFKWTHIAVVHQGKKDIIYCDGIPTLTVDGAITIPDRGDWEFGKGDFTITFWARLKTFDPRTWTTAQHFAFARHFRRVS